MLEKLDMDVLFMLRLLGIVKIVTNKWDRSVQLFC